MKGRERARRLRQALRGRSLLPSREPRRTEAGLAAYRTREAYVDALFRELEADPAIRPRGRRAGPVLLGVGLVLILVGALAMVWVKAPELLLSLALGVNVLAVLCVALGILLLPERPPPAPAGAGAAGARGGLRRGRVRFRLSLPHRRIRHARH